jgi:hypothetical protein
LARQRSANLREAELWLVGTARLIVGLQKKLRLGTSEIILDDDDQEAIAHYAFDFKQGG